MKHIEIDETTGRKIVSSVNNLPSKTDQSFKEDCDVNFIVNKFTKTGIFPESRGPGVFADMSNIPDLTEAMTTVTNAQQAFNELPAETRKRFGNSPVELYNFLMNPKNDDEAIKLGFKTRLAPPVSKQAEGAPEIKKTKETQPKSEKTKKEDS